MEVMERVVMMEGWWCHWGGVGEGVIVLITRLDEIIILIDNLLQIDFDLPLSALEH